MGPEDLEQVNMHEAKTHLSRLVERVEGLVSRAQVEQAFAEIRELERQLVDDGMVLVKLFLHISKKEQRRRFDKCEADAFLHRAIEVAVARQPRLFSGGDEGLPVPG